MCDDFGYYNVTQGYRRVPGNVCRGGAQLDPIKFKCRSTFSSMIFSWKTFFVLLLVLGYFGKHYIEAILILLPIPDPEEIKEKLGKLVKKDEVPPSGKF